MKFQPIERALVEVRFAMDGRNSQGYSEREIYNATLAGIDEAMAPDIAINYAANRAQALRNLTPAQECAIVFDVLRPDPDAARGFKYFTEGN